MAESTTPVLESVKPVTDNLSQITGELHRFATAANPALAHLPGVLDKVNSLLDQAKPVVADLGPGASSLLGITQAALPLGNAILDHPTGVQSTLDNFMNGAADWAMTTSSFDGLSHFFRADVPVAGFANAALGCVGSGTPLGCTTSPAPPVVKKCGGTGPSCPPGQVGPPFPGSIIPPASSRQASAPTPPPAPNLGNLFPDLTNLLPNLTNMINATGLTPNQEQGLLGQLLGGL